MHLVRAIDGNIFIDEHDLVRDIRWSVGAELTLFSPERIEPLLRL